MICIYHSRDLDGWMSAAIIKLWHEQEKIDGELELIGWDYGQPLPVLSGEKHSELAMVDISFPMGTMESLLDPFNVTWIDHHKSAIDECRNYFRKGNPFKGLQFSDYAACELTWMHLFDGIKMPELVRLLGRYDCFGHKGTDEELKVLEFQYGARQEITNVEDAFSKLTNSLKNTGVEMNILDRISTKGKAIYEYLCVEARQKYAKKFEIWLDGKLFACVNDWRLNPVNFGINYHADGYDGFACFWYENRQFSYSLYNDNGKVDCSVIAKKRGGGGHKGASGFISKRII